MEGRHILHVPPLCELMIHLLSAVFAGKLSKEGADALGEEFIPVGREVFGVKRTRS